MAYHLLIQYSGLDGVGVAEEDYQEELTLRPLIDGKVLAHFSFSMLLHGAVARSPNTLGTDDTCTPARITFYLIYCLTDARYSAALWYFPFGTWPDPPRNGITIDGDTRAIREWAQARNSGHDSGWATGPTQGAVHSPHILLTSPSHHK